MIFHLPLFKLSEPRLGTWDAIDRDEDKSSNSRESFVIVSLTSITDCKSCKETIRKLISLNYHEIRFLPFYLQLTSFQKLFYFQVAELAL